MRSSGFGTVLARWFAICASGVGLVACGSHGGSPGTGTAGNGGGGTGGFASGVAGSGVAGQGGASTTGGGGDGAPVPDGGLPPGAACTPGVGAGPLSDSNVFCTNAGTTFGVPNGAAVFGQTYVLPSPLVPNADNAFSFQLTGSGPFNFELWGTNTPCMAEELLWWGPSARRWRCRPSRAA